jgi:type I restriction enzyme S subunit
MGISRWKKSSLKSLCNRIGDGLHGTPIYDDGSDIFFINGNNLKNGIIVTSSETKKVTDSVFAKNYIELNEYSLLLSINGTIGEMAFYSN